MTVIAITNYGYYINVFSLNHFIYTTYLNNLKKRYVTNLQICAIMVSVTMSVYCMYIQTTEQSPAQYAEISNRVYVEIGQTSAQTNKAIPPEYDDVVQYAEVSEAPQNGSRMRKTGV